MSVDTALCPTCWNRQLRQKWGDRIIGAVVTVAVVIGALVILGLWGTYMW